MPKTREKKAAIVEELREKFQNAQSVVLTDFRGINVEEITELRRKLRESQVDFVVAKNTLTWLVARDMGLDGLKAHLTGPTAIAFGMKDAVAPAKVISDFIKEKKKMEIKAGVLSGKVISLDEVKALADLPPREILLAKLLGCIQAPLVNMASVLQAPLRGFATAVDALRQKQAGA